MQITRNRNTENCTLAVYISPCLFFLTAASCPKKNFYTGAYAGSHERARAGAGMLLQADFCVLAFAGGLLWVGFCGRSWACTNVRKRASAFAGVRGLLWACAGFCGRARAGSCRRALAGGLLRAGSCGWAFAGRLGHS